MAGLSFLSKKSWHTSNISNQEKVWLAEQKAAAEDKKTRELQAQIKQEREREEFLRLAGGEDGGGKGKAAAAGDRGTNWMYEGGISSAAGGSATAGDAHPSAAEAEEARNEAYLLGKEYVPEGQVKHEGDFAVATTMTGALEKASTYGAAIAGADAGANNRGREQGTLLRLQDNSTTLAAGAPGKTIENCEDSANERNQNFHLAHEDPMFAVHQRRRLQEKEAEKKLRLMEKAGYKVQPVLARGRSGGETADPDGKARHEDRKRENRDRLRTGHDGRRHEKRKRKHRTSKSESRKSKRRRSKGRHRDRSPSSRSSYSSSSTFSSHGSRRRHKRRDSKRRRPHRHHSSDQKGDDEEDSHRRRRSGSRERAGSSRRFKDDSHRGENESSRRDCYRRNSRSTSADRNYCDHNYGRAGEKVERRNHCSEQDGQRRGRGRSSGRRDDDDHLETNRQEYFNDHQSTCKKTRHGEIDNRRDRSVDKAEGPTDFVSSGKAEGYGLVGTLPFDRNGDAEQQQRGNLGPDQNLLKAKKEEVERERQSLLNQGRHRRNNGNWRHHNDRDDQRHKNVIRKVGLK